MRSSFASSIQHYKGASINMIYNFIMAASKVKKNIFWNRFYILFIWSSNAAGGIFPIVFQAVYKMSFAENMKLPLKRLD